MEVQIKILPGIWRLLALILALAGCKKEADHAGISTGFPRIFEDFWTGMETNYVYWDIDTTDWGRIHKVYEPLFAELNIEDDADVRRSVDYFRQMIRGLADGHYAISFTMPSLQDSALLPALEKKRLTPGFHSPFLYMGIDTGRLDKGFRTGSFSPQSGEQISAVSGTIGGRILYFACSGFYLQQASQSTAAGNTIKDVLSFFFASLPASAIKGVIIDVRNNSGGDIADLDFFMGRLTRRPLSFGYTHYKSDNGPLDFTPWITAVINPAASPIGSGVPVIVLADNYSISLAEAVTMAIRTLPNGVFIGENTWGATGPITAHALYNDGPFSVDGFLSVNTSSAAFHYRNDQSYEGRGFPPDILIPFNLPALMSGKDACLDSAIARLR